MSNTTQNHAARILSLASPTLRADTALRDYLTKLHRLSPAEKRDITHSVYATFRWQQWLDPKASAQAQIVAALDLQTRYDANPAAIKPQALAALAIPAWLVSEMDEIPTGWLQQLQRLPALWLRARPGTAEKLAATLGHCATTPSAPDALHFTGPQDLYRTESFQNGAFEIQDLASQLVGHACAPQPGETWWDACSGEGGKTLHLADLMRNKGLIWASDRSLRRLDSLKRRFSRAQLFNVRIAPWEGTEKLPTKTKFDGILLDAPCSGVGTWQRNPHARWTTQPTDIAELAVTQANLLGYIAGSLKPKGRLIYAVCTLTRRETTAIVETFTAAHPELELVNQTTIWPHAHHANGMYHATWRKR